MTASTWLSPAGRREIPHLADVWRPPGKQDRLIQASLIGLGTQEGGPAMKGLKRMTAAVALAAVGLVAAVPGASGAADTASCVGAGSSSVAPGQALTPFSVPGERATISHDVLALADAAGTTPGQLTAGAAQAHGTAQVCFPGGPP